MIEPVVLFVDDEPAILRAIKRLFRQSPFRILTADGSTEALLILQETPVSVVVSDYSMPERTGAELLAIVREICPGTVRMILSGNNDQEATIDAINQGAVSKFLTKPWEDRSLLREIDAAVKIWQSRIYIDASKALLNQAALIRFMDSTLLRQKPTRSLVVLISVRNLDSLQLNLGVEGLFRFLTALAPAYENLAECQMLALLDDQHFCGILDLSDTDHSASSAIQSLLNAFPANPIVNQQEHRIEYDVGYVEVGPYDTDGLRLVRNAQLAIQNARNDLSNTVVVYDERMNATRGRQSKLETGLNSALTKEEFTLYYQPKIALSTHSLHGAEALIRWNSEGIGMVSPTEFIPLTERSGLIVDSGEWVINEAILQWTTWFPDSLSGPAISVNISPRQLKDPRFLQRLESTLHTHPIQPSLLELEITESMMVDDIDRIIEVLEVVRKLGVKVSIDDFGTGYSSLSYLSRLPVDTIKIDRSFILPMLESTEKLTLVRNLITLGHDLGMQLVAEGVENKDQLNVLGEFGCDVIQGYYFSPPVPAAEFIAKTSDILTLQTHDHRLLSANSR